MSHFYTAILFFLYITPVNCQFKYGSSLADSILIIANSKSSTLYVGIDNPIELNLGINEHFENFYLFTNNGYTFIDSMRFIVIPTRSGLSRIVLMKLNGNDTIIIGQRFYNVKTVPEPKLQIDTFQYDAKSSVLKSRLLAADSISIYVSSDIENSGRWFKVTRFTIGFIYGGLYRNHDNPGNRITYETKLLINNLGPGKEVIFKVFAEGEGNLIVEVPVYRLELY